MARSSRFAFFTTYAAAPEASAVVMLVVSSEVESAMNLTSGNDELAPASQASPAPLLSDVSTTTRSGETTSMSAVASTKDVVFPTTFVDAPRRTDSTVSNHVVCSSTRTAVRPELDTAHPSVLPDSPQSCPYCD